MIAHAFSRIIAKHDNCWSSGGICRSLRKLEYVDGQNRTWKFIKFKDSFISVLNKKKIEFREYYGDPIQLKKPNLQNRGRRWYRIF